MKKLLLSVGILLSALVSLINGTPEIKSADPSQRFQTPAFLTEQERRYTEAVKGHYQYRPLPTQVIPQKTDRHESLTHGSQYGPTLSPTQFERKEVQYGNQYRPLRTQVIPQKTDRHESLAHGSQYGPTLSPTQFERKEVHYGNQYRPLRTQVIPQKTERHENYSRGNQLLTPTQVTPQKTDRHYSQERTGRNEKLYRVDSSSRSRQQFNGPDSAVQQLWSTRDGSVKSEITDTTLKLLRSRYNERMKR